MTLPAPTSLPRFLGGAPQPQYRLLRQGSVPRPAPAPQPPAPRTAADVGKSVLQAATSGLGLAGVAYPPAVPIAAITGAVQALDAQIGQPVATVVGATVQVVGEVGSLVVKGVEGAVEGIGSLFEGLFGK